MKESSKSFVNFSDFEKSILMGTVLDIGAGDDPVVPHAEIFDLDHGDANHISSHVNIQYDCVYSSHCLEHMIDPKSALEDWLKLVKPGGYLFVIVPDEDLYEQGCFPSRFNSDHKHTFTISKKKSWSPKSLNVLDLYRSIVGTEMVSVYLNDIHFDRCLYRHGFGSKGFFLFRILYRFMCSLQKRGMPNCEYLNSFLKRYVMVDQTRGDAQAQIELILQKK